MVTGWSNDGMKVVTSGRKMHLSRFRSIMGNFYWRGNPSPLIYLELQTANSPQTDCSLYMNRFLLGSMSSGITESKIIHFHFWFKTFTTQKLPWENSRDIDPDGQHDLLSFWSRFWYEYLGVWYHNKTVQQKTFFKEFDCKNLEGDNETLIFENGGYLYISSWFK
jgi:hypothetical protein